MPKISAYGRPVESPFGLLGTNENSLTFALGYTLARVPSLLRWFLSECGVKGLSEQQLQAVTIELQKYDRKLGITDIEVRLPGRFHIIVEAKVGLGLPQSNQVQRY